MEALVQLQLADVPGLVELLPRGVELVQELADPGHQALGVHVAAPPPSAATPATVRVRLGAVDPLQQPGGAGGLAH